MDNRKELLETADQEERHHRAVTYLPPDTLAWLQKQVEQLAKVGRTSSVSELMRECIHQGAAAVEAETNAVVELRSRGGRS